MSNNPFLKPKETTNRFHFLDDENINKSFKETSNKINQKNVRRNSNSFIHSANKTGGEQEINRDRQQHFQYRKNNPYTSSSREQLPTIIATPNFTDLNSFPELSYIKENTNNIKTSTDFKDALKHIVDDEAHEINTIPIGWEKLSFVNGKTFIESGPKTHLMLKQDKNTLKQQEEPKHNTIFKTFERIIKNWELYEKNYDSIHGKGAYDDKFRLPPVYGPEYNSDIDTDDDDDEHREIDEDEI